MPADASAGIHAALERLLARAKTHRQQGDLHNAAALYRQCASLMAKYATYAVSPKAKASREETAREYLALAEQLESGKVPITASEGPVGPEDYEGEIARLIHKSTVTWHDIGGLDQVKSEIKTAYAMDQVDWPQGVKLHGWKTMLFYGPPGTGKTLLAAATSKGLEATFFDAKMSDLLSKYFGEAPKLIAALFRHARRREPSVVFLDEFDSLGMPRGLDDGGAERKVVGAMLNELDGLAGKDSDAYVLTIGATNVPWLVDKALLSRFQKKIYIPLPDQAARRRILEINLQEKGLQTALSVEQLVDDTEGFSGREVVGLCTEATNHMVGEMNPDLVAEVDKGLEAVRRYKGKLRPLTKADFDWAMKTVQPETSEADLKSFQEWRTSQD